MDTLTKNGITPIPSENCLHELKYIEDQDLNKFLCIGLLLNQKPVYLLNIDSTKLTDEKVKNILTKFNSHKSLLFFNSIIKLKEFSLLFCYEYTNWTLINYLYFIDQNPNNINNCLRIRLFLYKQFLELIYYFDTANISFDYFNPKLFFIVDGIEPVLKLLYHSKFKI